MSSQSFNPLIQVFGFNEITKQEYIKRLSDEGFNPLIQVFGFNS